MNTTIPANWRDRADIPNQDGFVLTLLMADHSVVPARVFKGGDGIHRLKRRNGDRIQIANVVGWRSLLGAFLLALSAAANAAQPTSREIVAAVLVAEAGGEREPVRSMQAVKEVVQMRAWKQQRTEVSIVTERWQFSCLNRIKPERLVAIAKQHPRWNDALRLASAPVKHATVWQSNHYHALTVLPAWAKGVRPVAIVGGHAFYRL